MSVYVICVGKLKEKFYQEACAEYIKRLSRQGLSIVMTTHYPNHAFICDADVLLLQREKDIQIGSSEQIVTEENIQSAYGICSRIVTVSDNKGAHVKACVPFADM